MAQFEDGRWALGITFIVCVAALWAGASVLTQFIYDRLHFDEPFVLTYIGTALFFVYLPGWVLASHCGWVEDPPFRRAPLETKLVRCRSARERESKLCRGFMGLLGMPRVQICQHTHVNTRINRWTSAWTRRTSS